MAERDNTPKRYKNEIESGGQTSKEQLVLETIQQIEVPFMEAMREAYGNERGWRLCGPASIALSRILSAKAGIPIGHGIEGEHIELEVGIYDPQNEPDRLQRMEEQTYIKYYVGDGSVYYIDPIYGLLMGGVQDLQGAIQIEKYQVSEIDKALLERHNLHPFSPNHPDITKVNPWNLVQIKVPLEIWYVDSIGTLNDERATMDICVSDSGHQMISDWNKTEAVITKFAPDWQTEDHLKAKADRYIQVSNRMMKQMTRGGNMLRMEIEDDFLPMPSDYGFSMEPQRMKPMRMLFREEIEYKDQKAQLENWLDDIKSQGKQEVLTYHIDNERYVLKQGKGLVIYKDGSVMEITGERIQKLKKAVQKTRNKKLINYINENLSE